MENHIRRMTHKNLKNCQIRSDVGSNGSKCKSVVVQQLPKK